MQSPAAILPAPRPGVLPMTSQVEAAQRGFIVDEALSWVGTPYRQWGATKGIAVDCAMLLVRCWVDAGIFEPFDPRPYPPEWHLHQGAERYLQWLETLALEKTEPEPGDIVVFRYGRCFSHAGVMISATRLVHAFADSMMCRLSDLTDGDLAEFSPGMARPRKFFSVWAKLRQLDGAA